jgi:nicotinamide phosphoribosyltransferase
LIGDKSVDVYKDPVTDHGKKSKAGRLDLVKWMNGSWQTVTLSPDHLKHEFSAMRTVYENGEILIDDSFENIRNRALAD